MKQFRSFIRSFSIPEILFYVLILALPFEELITIGGGSIAKWIGLLFIISSVFEFRTFYRSFPYIFIGYFLYAAIGLAGDLVQAELSISVLNEAMRPVLTGIFMVAAYNLAVSRSVVRILVVLSCSAIIFAVFQYSGWATGVTNTYSQVVDGEKLDRASALGTDPNFVAVYMSLAVIPGILAIAGTMSVNWFVKILASVGAVVATGGILMTGSRGGLLALIVGIFSVLFVTNKFVARLKVILVACGCLVFLGFAVWQNPLFRMRLQDSFEKRDTAAREDIWQDALRMASQSPLCGFGNRAYQHELGRFGFRDTTATHNVPLAILLGSGAVGLLGFTCFYTTAAYAAWRNRKSIAGMLVFPWFAITFAGSLSLNLDVAKWYWLIVTLALVTDKACHKKTDIKAFVYAQPDLCPAVCPEESADGARRV